MIAFSAIASVTVAVPLLAHLIAGPRVMPALERLQAWLDRNAAAITAIVLAAIAVALGVGGATSLLNS